MKEEKKIIKMSGMKKKEIANEPDESMKDWEENSSEWMGLSFDNTERDRRRQQFRSKFAMNPHTGSYKLKADGCFMRHDRTRREQEMTPEESMIKNLEMRNTSEYDEKVLQNYLGQLQRKGVPLKEATVEQYIINNIEEIDL
jgi:hypothetical protein